MTYTKCLRIAVFQVCNTHTRAHARALSFFLFLSRARACTHTHTHTNQGIKWKSMSAKQKSEFEVSNPMSENDGGNVAAGEARRGQTGGGSPGEVGGGHGVVGGSITNIHDGLRSSLKCDKNAREVGGAGSSRVEHDVYAVAMAMEGGALGVSLGGLRQGLVVPPPRCANNCQKKLLNFYFLQQYPRSDEEYVSTFAGMLIELLRFVLLYMDFCRIWGGHD